MNIGLQFFAETPVSGKIERKYFVTYLDGSFGADKPSWVIVGKDLEEYATELNPDVESTKNILGENSVTNKGYDVSAEADPYYAYIGDPMFERLQKIVDERISGDGTLSKAVEVHLWTLKDGVCEAYIEDAHVIPSSYGGDTAGYNIPFTVYHCGNRTKGTWDTATKTFTPATQSVK